MLQHIGTVYYAKGIPLGVFTLKDIKFIYIYIYYNNIYLIVAFGCVSFGSTLAERQRIKKWPRIPIAAH